MVLSFGLLAVAILALVAMFISGVKLSAQSRNITVATEIGRGVLEEIRAQIKVQGFSYLPTGDYSYDGRVPDAQAGPPYFPPAPYPGSKLNNQEYQVVVTGKEPSVDRLKQVRVDVYWTATSHISLETRFTP